MKDILSEKMIECSTKDTFQFSIICEECKKKWKSPIIFFSKARIQPETEGKRIIYDALYQKEKEETRKQALKLSEEHFSVCPICHRLVCDDCFMVCDDLDMCKSCAEKLNEKGSIVSSVWNVQNQNY